jgi:hypothetical protein
MNNFPVYCILYIQPFLTYKLLFIFLQRIILCWQQVWAPLRGCNITYFFFKSWNNFCHGELYLEIGQNSLPFCLFINAVCNLFIWVIIKIHVLFPVHFLVTSNIFFSRLVFPTLQWYIHIICSRENHRWGIIHEPKQNGVKIRSRTNAGLTTSHLCTDFQMRKRVILTS